MHNTSGDAPERPEQPLGCATTQAQNEVVGGLLLDVVVGQGAVILQLLAGKDEALLVWVDSLLVLDLGFDLLDGVRSTSKVMVLLVRVLEGEWLPLFNRSSEPGPLRLCLLNAEIYPGRSTGPCW